MLLPCLMRVKSLIVSLYLMQLPSINYRISADYGRLEMVKTSSSRAKDFFGSTMNLCAKMNSKAKPNSLVIGESLFKHVKSLGGYGFGKADSYSVDHDTKYIIYSVDTSRQSIGRFSGVLHARRTLNKLSDDMIKENVKAETERARTKSYQISYSVLNIGRSRKRALTDLATSIDVHMFEGSIIPFVPSADYQSLHRQDKSFIYGRSGCGKSRVIYEIIKKRLAEFNRVFIINPRPILGIESRRIGLSKLVDELNSGDAVIWDNFPDDLLNRDIYAMEHALKIVSSKRMRCLLVALKPKYLELSNDITDMSELYKNNIYYERDSIQAVLEAYGNSISPFKNIYQKHVAKNLIRVAGILWQKEPLPITVLDFFKELVQNKQLTQSRI